MDLAVQGAIDYLLRMMYWLLRMDWLLRAKDWLSVSDLFQAEGFRVVLSFQVGHEFGCLFGIPRLRFSDI